MKNHKINYFYAFTNYIYFIIFNNILLILITMIPINQGTVAFVYTAYMAVFEEDFRGVMKIVCRGKI